MSVCVEFVIFMLVSILAIVVNKHHTFKIIYEFSVVYGEEY